MMVSEGAIDPVIVDVRLRAEDFYRDRHRTIYGAIHDLYERREPVDALTVAELLAQHGELEEVGGRDDVSRPRRDGPGARQRRHYAQIVKQNALLRRLLGAAQPIQQSVHEREGEPRAARRAGRAAALQRRPRGAGRATSATIARDPRRRDRPPREARQGRRPTLTGTPSGFRDLDEITGGFQPGNLIVIAARPAMGKSSPRLQHRRERRLEARQAGRLLLAGDVGDRAGPPLHRHRRRGSPPTGCARARSRARSGRGW